MVYFVSNDSFYIKQKKCSLTYFFLSMIYIECFAYHCTATRLRFYIDCKESYAIFLAYGSHNAAQEGGDVSLIEIKEGTGTFSEALSIKYL